MYDESSSGVLVRLSRLLFASAFCLWLGCGKTSSVQVNLSGATAFADANVRDVVFIVRNIPTSSGGLDQDHDGHADVFVFPSSCGASMPAGCGFPVHSGDTELGDIPLNFNYKVTVRLRDTSGATLYSGDSTFSNVENAPAVTIAIN